MHINYSSTPLTPPRPHPHTPTHPHTQTPPPPPPHHTPPHRPTELLEAYVVDCNNQDAKLSNLLTRMQNAEQLMALKLDTARNQILVTNMSLQVASVLIAFGAYVSGIFGMNLDNTVTIMPVYGVFSIVWVSTLAIIIVGNLAIMYYYERTGVIPATIRMHNRISNTLRGSADGFTTKLAVKSKNFFRFK